MVVLVTAPLLLVRAWISFVVHNGKIFNKVFVTEDMVGHKLGEFSQTRIFKGHSSKRIKT